MESLSNRPPKENMEAAGQELRSLRGTTSLRALAREIFADPSTLSRIERGQLATINPLIIERYISHSDLEFDEAMKERFKIEILCCGRIPMSLFEASVLAETLQALRRYREEILSHVGLLTEIEPQETAQVKPKYPSIHSTGIVTYKT